MGLARPAASEVCPGPGHPKRKLVMGSGREHHHHVPRWWQCEPAPAATGPPARALTSDRSIKSIGNQHRSQGLRHGSLLARFPGPYLGSSSGPRPKSSISEAGMNWWAEPASVPPLNHFIPSCREEMVAEHCDAYIRPCSIGSAFLRIWYQRDCTEGPALMPSTAHGLVWQSRYRGRLVDAKPSPAVR